MKNLFLAVSLFLTAFTVNAQTFNFVAIQTAEYEMDGPKLSEHQHQYGIQMNHSYPASQGIFGQSAFSVTVDNYCGRALYLSGGGDNILYDSQNRPYLIHCTSSNGYKYDVRIYYDEDILKITDYRRDRIVKMWCNAN
jgi:hypothetical protein